MELAVYYDESYPAPWLGQHAGVLRQYLEPRGFKLLNAEELKSWICQKLTGGTCHQTSLVFSQDAVPDTVFPAGVDCANILFRKYLDDGGRIIWLGDVPLWYRAHRSMTEEPLQQTWQYGVPWALLGTVPLIADSSSCCEWVDKLKHVMKSRWYSMRPVNIERPYSFAGLKITPLAYAKVTLLPSSYNMLMISRWKKAGKKVAQISAQVGVGGLALGGGLSLTEAFPKELGIDKPLTLACAWHVRFNEKHPTQGFYRFVDAQIDEINSRILEDAELLAKLGMPV